MAGNSDEESSDSDIEEEAIFSKRVFTSHTNNSFIPLIIQEPESGICLFNQKYSLFHKEGWL